MSIALATLLQITVLSSIMFAQQGPPRSIGSIRHPGTEPRLAPPVASPEAAEPLPYVLAPGVLDLSESSPRSTPQPSGQLPRATTSVQTLKQSRFRQLRQQVETLRNSIIQSSISNGPRHVINPLPTETVPQFPLGDQTQLLDSDYPGPSSVVIAPEPLVSEDIVPAVQSEELDILSPTPEPETETEIPQTASSTGPVPSPLVDGPIDRVRLANNLFAVGEFALALDLYRQEQGKSHDSPEPDWLTFQIATCHRNLGSISESQSHYRRIAGRDQTGVHGRLSRFWLDVMDRQQKFKQRATAIDQVLQTLSGQEGKVNEASR